MNEQVEWLKAQVEMYFKDHPIISEDENPESVLAEFIQYVEEKFTPRGLLDR